MADEVVIFITTNSKEEAEKIARSLVEDKLAACVNIVSKIQSIFHWQNEVCEEQEVLMIVKSVKTNIDQVVKKVKQLHSYEVPEIIALPIIAGSIEYLKWIQEETKQPCT